jgi:hypothetical protein
MPVYPRLLVSIQNEVFSSAGREKSDEERLKIWERSDGVKGVDPVER